MTSVVRKFLGYISTLTRLVALIRDVPNMILTDSRTLVGKYAASVAKRLRVPMWFSHESAPSTGTAGVPIASEDEVEEM